MNCKQAQWGSLWSAFLSGIGIAQLSAQNGKDGTGSYSEWCTNSYSDPVYCDGVLIDWLDLTIPSIIKHIFLKVTG